MTKIIHWYEYRAKRFFQVMHFLEKLWKNVRNHRDSKLTTAKAKRSYLESEPNYHTIKPFSDILLAIQMKRTQMLLNKTVSLDLSILKMSKIVMHEFWHDYVKRILWRKSKIMLHGHRQFGHTDT